MAIQTVFQRYEMKYLLTPDQKEAVLRAMQPYMEPDRYGRTSIRNLYYDTDNYRLIRRSIERPVYKEKLRVRSYGRAEPDGVVFAELKKKYKHTACRFGRRRRRTGSPAGGRVPFGRRLRRRSIILFPITKRCIRSFSCPTSAKPSPRRTAACSASPLMKTSFAGRRS